MRGREHAVALAALAALAGCGGGGGDKTAANGPDGGGSAGAPNDAAGTPMPPALGAQLDRMGRPGVGEFLIGTFVTADAADRKAAYRQASDPKTWLTTPLATNVTIEDELKANLAAFDAIDAQQPVGTATLPGCGNAFDYHAPTTVTSYTPLADLLGDDQLYLDTAKPTCSQYFSLEIEVVGRTIAHMTCGGRTLSHDALDTLISMIASGMSGLTIDLNAVLIPVDHSAATPHADVTDTFPFLGAPNP
jgi:hypothetical protein